LPKPWRATPRPAAGPDRTVDRPRHVRIPEVRPAHGQFEETGRDSYFSKFHGSDSLVPYFPDGGKCYLETESRDFCGHFRIRSATLSRDRFHIAFGNAPRRRIVVLFSATDSVYAEAKRVLQIIIPKIEIS
jgi:hypothetical protein